MAFGSGITDSRDAIIKRGRELAGALRERDSSFLPPVLDAFSQGLVLPWRLNGCEPEHPVHRMMSRVGGFPPALARYFIARYSDPGDVILDPFCGKGTTLFEAAQLGRYAIGGDLAPDAAIVTRAKCSSVSTAEVINYIQQLDPGLAPPVSIPPKVRVFFAPLTLRQIISIRSQLLRDMKKRGRAKEVSTFVCGILLGILHGHSRVSLSLPSNQCFAMSPNYVRGYVVKHGLKRPERNVKQCLIERCLQLLPQPRMTPAQVFNASAERCAEYVTRSGRQARLILTSPPYLNRQTYIKDSWLRLWLLGADIPGLNGASLETGSVPIFVARMKTVLHSMQQALMPGGKLVIVCGRAGAKASSGASEIRISDLCLYAARSERQNGWRGEELIHDRKIMKRGSYFAVHRGIGNDAENGNSPRLGEEEILILTKSRPRIGSNGARRRRETD